MKVTLLRTPAGNFGRLRRGLERERARVDERSPREVTGNERAVVLAGVSSFTTLSRSLAPARSTLRRMVEAGVPLMGVCAGMQVLFGSSEEGPGRGLDLLSGRVRRLRARRVPNLGWSRLARTDGEGRRLMEGVAEGSYAYFAHSYRVPALAQGAATTTEYRGEDFPSALEHGNLWGLQFHPEVSSSTGTKVLRNFIAYAEEASR
ncbi:MAG: imidazole glycerol phosphate synthase subunit HisH [Euryarchaeota archaeon]|nr:imidazole glycerol phosphate synthase subunit HisH [Euryarchaeota archaeon]MDE1836750.1 imidazole glycerol phosphate synthase subunit HisH [Euryarchaeota archaeon]MDE1879768.1 imidazole glycerol phosphate synthase subunit HisH [Euryarchaeota archaeon]MDE2044734.1 imidazole glycerol phosphate synthase subunit HisH [Thermoplasmata archaeon]